MAAMGVLRSIARFFGGLWAFARNSWVDVGMGLRPGSRASGLVVFLFLVFFLVGLALVLLGFDLGDVDRWIDAQSGWLDVIGTILFRIVCGVLLVLCLPQFYLYVAHLNDPVRPGCACLIMAAIVGYLGYIGAFIGP